MNKYNCDECGKEIIGRKAYDILISIKKKNTLCGFCSKECQYEHKYKTHTIKTTCSQCNKEIIKNNSDIKNKNIFCSQKCSAIFNNKFRDYSNIKTKFKKSICVLCNKEINILNNASTKNSLCEKCHIIKLKKDNIKYSKFNTCRYCKIKFKKTKNKGDYYCSNDCKNNYIFEKRKLSKYRTLCLFKFNLNDYPKEFDFELIKKYGWYSPKNKKNNLNGVSRDHMVSIKFGFINKVDPIIISHPANCRLILHNDNVKKYDSCSVSLEELLLKIKKWDEKYNSMGNGTA